MFRRVANKAVNAVTSTQATYQRIENYIRSKDDRNAYIIIPRII